MTLALVALFLAFGFQTRAAATGGEGEAWPVFTESSACGAQRVTTPIADRQGWLSRSDVLRGEFAAMFGRTVDDVFSHLVKWPIPGSGTSIAIHERLMPALTTATTSLEESLADGLEYRVRSKTTSSAAARTIGGKWRMSRHTFGTAFDINADTNPFRRDNELITDMPPWWVGAFLDAGFCWGGLWVGSKDTMHFSWQGPAFGGYDQLPPAFPPLTDEKAIDRPSTRITVVPPAPPGTLTTVLADVDGNGAVDVARISETDNGLLIDASVASMRHNACSSRSSLLAGLGGLAGRASAMGFGDWDGRGGKDFWLVNDDEGSLRLTVRWAFGDFAAETTARTSVPTPGADAWISSADYDADGALDVYVIDAGNLTVWTIDPRSGDTSEVVSVPVPMPSADRYFLGDADVDQRPDLWAIVDGAIDIATAADRYATVSMHHEPLSLPSRVVAAAASDYDGDGRADLVTFDGTAKQVWLANTRLPDGLPLEVWFEDPELECTGETSTPNLGDLQFSSSGWIAKGSYEWRARNDLPVGCDPEDDTCMPPIVTARSLTEFFAWIDGLDAVGRTHEMMGPRAVARQGYVVPCSPQDTECWDRHLLRTEVSYYYGRFLADRRDAVPRPHRWVAPTNPLRGASQTAY